ncbi:MAG TPA: nucleotidyltransferase family protein [Draconibacterium sp.]|nr:nucleotidyltransferase family protein [Draconibacterium sp.]
MVNIPIILLAAGGSTRMRRPKQLLPWGNKTLIEHEVETLLKTDSPVNVVLGAKANLVGPVVEKYDVHISRNNNWENGMGSSIATGVRDLIQKFPVADGVLLALVDQPLVPPEHFQSILGIFQPGKKQIIASIANSGWKGVPVLFDKYYFEELQNLNGKEGAKKIIQQHRHAVKYIECGNLLEDMDTPKAYQQMLKTFQSHFTEKNS